MKLEIRKCNVQMKDGKPVFLNGQPVQSLPDSVRVERAVVEADTELDPGCQSAENCDKPYCAEWALCPACGRGNRIYGYLNVTNGVYVQSHIVPLGIQDVIVEEVKRLAKDQFGIEIGKVGTPPPEIVEEMNSAAAEQRDQDDNYSRIVLPDGYDDDEE